MSVVNLKLVENLEYISISCLLCIMYRRKIKNKEMTKKREINVKEGLACLSR